MVTAPISDRLNGTLCGDGILRIEFAPIGSRVRRVVSRSNTRPTGRFPSRRLNRPVCWDSPAELNWFRLLECDSSVIRFAEQPCTVHFRLAGIIYKHIPDSLVITEAVSTLWEVKSDAEARRPEVAARTRLLAEHGPQHGYQYRVALAEDLRRVPRLKNARFLLRHGRADVSFELREHARQFFATGELPRWDDVALGRHPLLALETVCRLILDGALTVNLDQTLDSQVLTPAPDRGFGVMNG